jgi:ketosteroid isomerase-like protein
MNLSLRLPLAFALAASLALVGCGDADSTDPTASAGQAGDDTARHITTMKRRIAANNAKDWDTWESLHTAGAARTAPELGPEPLVTAKAMRAGIEELLVTFPDYTLTLIEAFGDGDRLVARLHAKGTMLGSMNIDGNEIPPTGKVFEQDWVAVLTFDGELISSIDEFHDNYGVLIQLGLAR